jgi:CDGSH-type Zn-finger protein
VPDDATSTEGLVAVAQNCPSGAITYRRKDAGPEEAAPPVNLVQVRENGPLAVRGDLTIAGEAKGFRATLCRCGQSKNKPFCDGAHNVAKFAASGEPATGDVTALAVRNGPLDIRPQTNGPLLVKGNMEFISGTGRTFCKAEGAMLCRCGASGNKPFCDGSHARVGFKSA